MRRLDGSFRPVRSAPDGWLNLVDYNRLNLMCWKRRKAGVMRDAIGLFGAVALAVGLVAACSAEKAGAPVSAELPEGARQIMAKPAYAGARWLYHVVDPDSGDVLLSQRPDEMVLTGSTGKEFTIGTVYDTLGPDTRLSTPVYASPPAVDGVLGGDVILVAAGDLAMGGRGAMAGRVDVTVDATTPSHLEVTADPANPRTLVVSGSIPVGKPQLTIYRVPDAGSWARTLFIEALDRAGIAVRAPVLGPDAVPAGRHVGIHRLHRWPDNHSGRGGQGRGGV